MIVQTQWKELLTALRKILLSTELVETIKWGIPTYTINNKNVIGMGAFKTYAGIWFFNGVFLRDEMNVLINAQEGQTRGMRQWRFQDLSELDHDLIKAYVEEAIANQKEGKEIKPQKKDLIIPPELEKALNQDPKLKEYFNKFTTGKKREFAEHISEAKRDETKLKRLEKIKGLILQQIGLNDKYRR